MGIIKVHLNLIIDSLSVAAIFCDTFVISFLFLIQHIISEITAFCIDFFLVPLLIQGSDDGFCLKFCIKLDKHVSQRGEFSAGRLFIDRLLNLQYLHGDTFLLKGERILLKYLQDFIG